MYQEQCAETTHTMPFGLRNAVLAGLIVAGGLAGGLAAASQAPAPNAAQSAAGLLDTVVASGNTTCCPPLLP